MVLFLIGLAAGIISGMGIGGGAILIPALVIFFSLEQHVVQGVNLLFFIPTAIMALIIHIRNKQICFMLALPIMAFGLLGAYLGSRLALTLPAANLRKWFGIFLLMMGLYEVFTKRKNALK